MRKFECQCGNALFFKNSWCVNCQREVGWCPVCRAIQTLIPEEGKGYRCGNPDCLAPLRKCHNYQVEQVCNRCLPAPDIDPPQADIPPSVEATTRAALCDSCRFNRTIPDLSKPGNREKWGRLEAAKRRVLFGLDLLGLPYGDVDSGLPLPLSFEFKEDLPPSGHRWHQVGEAEQIYTGHADGNITINLREADPVERERARVDFNEAQRTLIGHFRHELGHYFWQLLVKEEWLPRFVEVFGDHENPAYGDALQRYYDNGPTADWNLAYISPYASMHPWEDFAETFAAYLDMVGMLDTDRYLAGGEVDPAVADLQTMVLRYQTVSLVANELTREIGLIDIVPKVFTAPVVRKLDYIHQLARHSSGRMVE